MDEYINIEQLLPDKYSGYKKIHYWDTDKKMIVSIIDNEAILKFYWFDPILFRATEYEGDKDNYYKIENG
jgi:hypothetical protein